MFKLIMIAALAGTPLFAYAQVAGGTGAFRAQPHTSATNRASNTPAPAMGLPSRERDRRQTTQDNTTGGTNGRYGVTTPPAYAAPGSQPLAPVRVYSNTPGTTTPSYNAPVAPSAQQAGAPVDEVRPGEQLPSAPAQQPQ